MSDKQCRRCSQCQSCARTTEIPTSSNGVPTIWINGPSHEWQAPPTGVIEVIGRRIPAEPEV